MRSFVIVLHKRDQSAVFGAWEFRGACAHLNGQVVFCVTQQVRDGDGLASQENRCREYATYKDYDVVEVFSDDMSGKFERRSAIDWMLAFYRLNKKNSHVVIIDDVSRFARNVQAHIKLRETLADAGGILESPSIEFGEDSDSCPVEHLLASVVQLSAREERAANLQPYEGEDDERLCRLRRANGI